MTDVAIAVRDLSLRYDGEERRALDQVSFEVRRGEILGILGATGAGKSTLLKTLAGVIPHHEHHAKQVGEITVLGRDLATYDGLTEITAEVGLVMQDPEVQLVNTVVREELAWGMENRGVPVEEIERRIANAAELFGITELLDRFTHALSGGEKQRVVVASIFCLNPSIMLLDEPTSELDPAGTESVMDAIQVLAGEGVTILVVEHKVEELALYTDRLMVMEEGRIVQSGTPREVLTGSGAPERPQVLEVALGLQREGAWPSPVLPLGVDEAVATWSQGVSPVDPKNECVSRA
jgi:energy-coupling factor transport system ATP-binding protein